LRCWDVARVDGIQPALLNSVLDTAGRTGVRDNEALRLLKTFTRFLLLAGPFATRFWPP